HVEHQPATLASLGLHRETRQLLQCLEHLAICSYEPPRHPPLLGVHNRDGSAVTVDVNVDVPIDVTDVEQHFKEVGCDIPLSLQQLLARLLRSFWGDLGSTLWGDLGSTLWGDLGSTLWVNLSVLWVNLSVEVCGA